ncbi:675_t:CDS:1, partial [Dentiscutata heterogama]
KFWNWEECMDYSCLCPNFLVTGTCQGLMIFVEMLRQYKSNNFLLHKSAYNISILADDNQESKVPYFGLKY